MKYLFIFKINDVCLSNTRYTLVKDGQVYTSNISKALKNKYVDKFIAKGYTILNGQTIEKPSEVSYE